MPVVPNPAAHGDLFAASLSHEMKTPLAALQAASRSLRKNLEGLLGSLLARQNRRQGDIDGLAPLIGSVLGTTAGERIATGLPSQSRLDAVALRLSGAGVSDDRMGAAMAIVRGGWEDQLDRLAPIFARGGTARIIEILDSASKLRSSLRSLDAAISRLSSLAARAKDSALDETGGVFAFASCLDETLATLQHEIPPGVRIEVRQEDGLVLSGSSSRFGQVLSNLIGNAIAALPPSGGEVVVEAARSGSATVVRIIDSGSGVPEQMTRTLFTPFSTTKAGGSGLGLFIAREIVRGLGGGLTCDSRPGRTCFEVRVPAPHAGGSA